jgi:hypothetical protein
MASKSLNQLKPMNPKEEVPLRLMSGNLSRAAGLTEAPPQLEFPG